MAHGQENRCADDGGDGIQGIRRRLQSSRVLASIAENASSIHARVVQVTPRLGTRVLVIHEAEHAEVINERAIGQHNVDVEPEAFEKLHFGDDDGVFEVIERVAEIGHWCVSERLEVLAWRECVGGPLEQEVVDVDEVSDAERTLFEFRGEVEGTHAHVLSSGGGGSVKINMFDDGREERRLTPMLNCFIEEVYQKRWYRIWAVATATCFLWTGGMLWVVERGLWGHALFEKDAGLVYEFAAERPEIFL